MTDLIIYYSRSGKTKTVAEVIAKETDGKLVEIKDKKNRKGGLNYLKGAVESLAGTKTSIEHEPIDLTEYDTVYIGTPVWASKPAPAVIEFLNEFIFEDINVITFATMLTSGGEKTVSKMNEIIKSKGGNVLKSFSLISKNDNLEELTLNALKE